ncbi:leucine-rich repeat-containing protein 37B isoform X2 [Heterocephalus glaber]|uniref:Leucine-rich repeat-containing protein 37B isoform X2 n=1 Tax=Heterocephalus glaber TaxID=10181 RepID=A0AAX6RJ66_HETGA|nr:leucine-rich repeat-containing protein 37B isoform X2 [Heterocephalus glaber]
MFVLCFWVLGLTVWPQLWLLGLVVPLPEWVQYPDQLKSEPLGPNFLFSPYTSTISQESLHALTASEEPGGFDYLGSSVPTKMFLLPLESTGELLPDELTDLHQGLGDQVARQERLPEVVSMLDGDQNQVLALPPRLERRIETPAQEQAADHQSLLLAPPPVSKGSTASQFASNLNLKKDLTQHWQLAKEVLGTRYQLATPKLQKQTVEDANVDPSVARADHESLYLGYQENPEEPPQPCEHKESSQFQLEAQAQNPQTLQIQFSVSQGKAPGQLSQPPEELEPSLSQQEDPAQPPALPSVTVQPLNVGLRISPELTTEADHSVALQKASPALKQPAMTLVHPHLTPITFQPLDVKPTTNQYSVNYMPEKALTEHSATRAIKICELCTCENKTLSCIGLSPVQRLHQVPVLEPDTYSNTFTVLNLSGNYITELHKDSFEGLVSLQYLDLSCNKIQFIERRTFEALPFLKFVILNHNPLTTIEDSSLFKLPELKYLDLGQTHVSFTALENILTMALELETLILPSHMVCCLCQFKKDIEVVCKTVKLHCDSICLINAMQCLGQAPTENPEGTFMKALQAWKKSTSTKLTIEPEKTSSEKTGIDSLGFMKEQLDINDESDIISALSYILPYFSQGNLDDVESTLLPFIQLLFSKVQHGNNTLGYLKNNTGNSSFQPVSNSSTFTNKLKKLYFMQNLLDAEIHEKIDEVKKKEKTAMLMQSSLFGPKFRRQIFPKKLESAQAQENNLAEVRYGRKRLQRLKKVIRRNRRNDFIHSILVLENASTRVQSMEGTKPILHSGKVHHFHKIHSLMAHRTPKTKLSEKLREENTHNKLMLVQRPQISAVRSFDSSHSGRFLSSGDLNFQESLVSELYAPLELSGEHTPVENHAIGDNYQGDDFALNSVPEETISEKTTQKNPSAADSAVTRFSPMPAVDKTRQAQWGHPYAGTDSPPKDFTSPLLSSPGDQFETYLNQQLQPFISNNDIRRLISELIWRLKMDCSKVHVQQLACAKLISKTGLLMKLLREQQEVSMSKAQWDADHWKSENSINGSTEDQREEKEQESRELTKVPGFDYYKLILPLSVMGVVIILMLIFCVIKIYSHRRASEETEEGYPRGFSQHWHGRYNMEHENKDGVPGFGLPLWLRDLYRPISASQVKRIASLLHGKDSFDDEGCRLCKVITEVALTESAIEDEDSEALEEVVIP